VNSKISNALAGTDGLPAEAGTPNSAMPFGMAKSIVRADAAFLVLLLIVIVIVIDLRENDYDYDYD
jgi:hypothetical protein